MTTATRHPYAFGSSVSLDGVEKLLLDVQDANSVITLDLSQCRNIDPGADSRLANAMRRWAHSRLEVTVPALDFQSKDWFRLFTRSGLGPAMALHAALVMSDGEDVTEHLREYYSSRLDVPANNAVTVYGIESGALTPTQDRFVATLLLAMRQSLPQIHDVVPRDVRRAIARLAHEAVTNVVDHAFARPWHDQADPLSQISMRWYRSITAKNSECGGLRSFITAHREHLPPEQQLAGWIEIVVGDDGVGISARHAQVDEEVIYAGPIAAEDEALLAALESSATVKPKALDAQFRGDAGYGTAIILESLRHIGAYAALRTGRRLVEFDPWRHAHFELNEAPLGWLPGTIVQVLLPVVNPQLRLA